MTMYLLDLNPTDNIIANAVHGMCKSRLVYTIVCGLYRDDRTKIYRTCQLVYNPVFDYLLVSAVLD